VTPESYCQIGVAVVRWHCHLLPLALPPIPSRNAPEMGALPITATALPLLPATSHSLEWQWWQ
jgi:hypothetical protein